MPLELGSLRQAILSLNAVLSRSNNLQLMTSLDDVTQQAIKAGAIQHFEFTYELSWKFMKRWLEMNVSPTAVDGVTRRELFRQAAEHKLIGDIESWMAHHYARNQTSQTYDASVAEEVYRAVDPFRRDVGELLAALEAHND